jgi:hypothetical protein
LGHSLKKEKKLSSAMESNIICLKLLVLNKKKNNLTICRQSSYNIYTRYKRNKLLVILVCSSPSILN